MKVHGVLSTLFVYRVVSSVSLWLRSSNSIGVGEHSTTVARFVLQICGKRKKNSVPGRAKIKRETLSNKKVSHLFDRTATLPLSGVLEKNDSSDKSTARNAARAYYKSCMDIGKPSI